MLMFVEDKTDDGTAKPFVLAMSTEAKEAYKAFWTSVEDVYKRQIPNSISAAPT